MRRYTTIDENVDNDIIYYACPIDDYHWKTCITYKSNYSERQWQIFQKTYKPNIYSDKRLCDNKVNDLNKDWLTKMAKGDIIQDYRLVAGFKNGATSITKQYIKEIRKHKPNSKGEIKISLDEFIAISKILGVSIDD